MIINCTLDSSQLSITDTYYWQMIQMIVSVKYTYEVSLALLTESFMEH